MDNKQQNCYITQNNLIRFYSLENRTRDICFSANKRCAKNMRVKINCFITFCRDDFKSIKSEK